jgi:hypothetical protein
MAFKVNVITTEDTNDGIEAAGDAVLLMASILYEHIQAKSTNEYQNDVEMLYNALRGLSMFLEHNLPEYHLQLPQLKVKKHCAFCGKDASEVGILVDRGTDVAICGDCINASMQGILQKYMERRKQDDTSNQPQPVPRALL